MRLAGSFEPQKPVLRGHYQRAVFRAKTANVYRGPQGVNLNVLDTIWARRGQKSLLAHVPVTREAVLAQNPAQLVASGE